MKTFAFKDSNNTIAGIGLVYMETGEFAPGVAEYVNRLGVDGGLLAYGNSVKHDSRLTTIVVDTANMPGADPDMYDKTFRAAFVHGGGNGVEIDMPKAKTDTHIKRRANRDVEMAPLDIESTIPAKAAAAEIKRQSVRDKNARIQIQIDAAATPDELKLILLGNQL